MMSQLAQAGSPAVRHRVGGHMEVAAIQRLLITKSVLLDLTVGRRRMAVQALSNDPHRDLGGAQTK
jgi:hypothetical protein